MLNRVNAADGVTGAAAAAFRKTSELSEQRAKALTYGKMGDQFNKTRGWAEGHIATGRLPPPPTPEELIPADVMANTDEIHTKVGHYQKPAPTPSSPRPLVALSARCRRSSTRASNSAASTTST